MTIKFDAVKEKELLNDGHFFCRACLMPVSIGDRSHQDERYCKNCYSVIKGESKSYGKTETVEELNAKYTGDLPAQWQKPVKKRTKKQPKEQMVMELPSTKKGKRPVQKLLKQKLLSKKKMSRNVPKISKKSTKNVRKVKRNIKRNVKRKKH